MKVLIASNDGKRDIWLHKRWVSLSASFFCLCRIILLISLILQCCKNHFVLLKPKNIIEKRLLLRCKKEKTNRRHVQKKYFIFRTFHIGTRSIYQYEYLYIVWRARVKIGTCCSLCLFFKIIRKKSLAEMIEICRIKSNVSNLTI